MDLSNTKKYGMIAGILRLVAVLFGFYSLYRSFSGLGYSASFFLSAYWLTALNWACMIFMAVSLIKDRPDLVRIAMIIQVGLAALTLLGTITLLKYYPSPAVRLITLLLSIAGSICFFIGLTRLGREGSRFCFIGAGLLVVSTLMSNLSYGYFFGTAINGLIILVNLASNILIGMYVAGKIPGGYPQPGTGGYDSYPPYNPQPSASNLSRLKDLYDRGLISREEYEANKASFFEKE